MVKFASALALAGVFLSSSGCTWPIRERRGYGGYGQLTRQQDGRDTGLAGRTAPAATRTHPTTWRG